MKDAEMKENALNTTTDVIVVNAMPNDQPIDNNRRIFAFTEGQLYLAITLSPTTTEEQVQMVAGRSR